MVERKLSDPVYQGYLLLHGALLLAPLVAGMDKFFYILVDWSIYLNPRVASVFPADLFMKIVGVVEIGVAAFIAWRPMAGGCVLAVWMLGIIANLLLFPGYYDVVLRDFGIVVAALALARLARAFD